MKRSVLLVSTTLALLLALSTTAPLAQTNEELQAQINELTKRMAALEQAIRTLAAAQPQARPSAAAAPAASANAGREVALQLYSKIDGLVATGNINQARGELEAFNQKYAGTQAAGWTRSLSRELEVVGKPVPEQWQIEKWYQGESEIELNGPEPTLIVFWESWCPHCRAEVPKIQSVYDQYHDRGLQVLGVTRITKTATEETVTSFIAENGISFPMAKETGEMAEYFNVKGIPAAAVVRNGKIAWRGHPIRLTDEILELWF